MLEKSSSITKTSSSKGYNCARCFTSTEKQLLNQRKRRTDMAVHSVALKCSRKSDAERETRVKFVFTTEVFRALLLLSSGNRGFSMPVVPLRKLEMNSFYFVVGSYRLWK